MYQSSLTTKLFVWLTRSFGINFELPVELIIMT